MSDQHQAEQVLFGDSGPWVRYLPLAWQASVNPVAGPFPPDPVLELVAASEEDHWARFEDTIAYWSPLLHLLCFGLGWNRPDLGLQRWLDAGGATKDPILALVDRWWGEERLTEFLAWAAWTGWGPDLAYRLGQARYTKNVALDRLEDRRTYQAVREGRSWQATWSGGDDPLHLIDHSMLPVQIEDARLGHEGFVFFDHRSVNPRNPSAIPRFYVTFDYYEGWYTYLPHYGLEKGSNGRSVRAELVCRPIGWLGEFRHCEKTNTYFRGRTSTHLLGN